jgi:hypothetical protein
MKKTLLTLGVFTFTALACFSQNMKITDLGGSTDISGTTHLVTATSSTQIVIDFDVYNENATTDDYIITRVNLTQPNGWQNEVCWGTAGAGLCYPNNTSQVWVTPAAVSLAPGEYGSLSIHVIPTSNYNQYAFYRYYCGTAADAKQDSIDVVVNQSLTIKELKKDISLSVSPNPASENVFIKVSNFEKGNFKIIDVLGNVVASESFNGSKSVDVSGFRNGVYFIVISEDRGKSINRKLVVKH